MRRGDRKNGEKNLRLEACISVRSKLKHAVGGWRLGGGALSLCEGLVRSVNFERVVGAILAVALNTCNMGRGKPYPYIIMFILWLHCFYPGVQ